MCRWLLLAFLLVARPVCAQLTTAVTGTVQDSNGDVYVNCSWSVTFVGQNTTPGAGPYAPASLLNGQQGHCDSSGNLSVSLADNVNVVTPTPSQWQFNICSAAGYTAGPYCSGNILITITGASQNITTTLTSQMPLLPSINNGGAPGGATGQAQFKNSLGQLSGAWPTTADLAAGANIVAKVNGIYSTPCTTTGCQININPQIATGLGNFSSFAANGQPVKLWAAPGTTSLTFTSTTAPAATFDWGPNNSSPLLVTPGAGISGLKMVGNNGTSTGVLMSGGVTGAPMSWVEHSQIQTFGTNVSYVNGGSTSSYASTLFDDDINGAASDGVFFNATTENTRILNSIFANNQVYGMHFGGTGVADGYTLGASFDSNVTAAVRSDASSSCRWDFPFNHYEDNGQTWQFFDMHGSTCVFAAYGGYWVKDQSGSSPAQMVNVANGTFLSIFPKVSGAGTITQYANCAASTTCLLIGVQKLSGVTNDFGGSGTVLDINTPYPQFQAQFSASDLFQWGVDGSSIFHILDKATSNALTLTGSTGAVAISGPITIGGTSNEIVLNGNTNSTTITVGNPAASRTWTIADLGGAATFAAANQPQTFSGAQTFSSQLTESVATGTAPFSVTSTTPVANLTTVPATYNHSGTQQTAVHMVIDTCTLGTNCAVTLSGSAVFTSSSSYQCGATDETGANAIKFAPSSGSAFTLTGTGTDVLSYICVGN